MTKHTLLVVEDDENLRLTLMDNLELEGYEVRGVSTVQEAKQAIAEVELCILDIMLPDGDGYALCEWARAQKINTIILMLTARTLDRDLDSGFEVGADDYLGKPYRMKELLLRVQALLRRGAGAVTPKQSVTPKQTTVINGHTIQWASRQVIKGDTQIHLTKKEFDMLKYLYDNLNTVLSRDQILNAVWGENVYVDNRTVDNFVANIKKRLQFQEASHYKIRSVRGVGYCMEENGPMC